MPEIRGGRGGVAAFSWLALIAAIGLCIGCDTLRGPTSTIADANFPEEKCVINALELTPGVTEVLLVVRKAKPETYMTGFFKLVKTVQRMELVTFKFSQQRFVVQSRQNDGERGTVSIPGSTLNQCPAPVFLRAYDEMIVLVGPRIASACWDDKPVTTDEFGTCPR